MLFGELTPLVRKISYLILFSLILFTATRAFGLHSFVLYHAYAEPLIILSAITFDVIVSGNINLHQKQLQEQERNKNQDLTEELK